jgi:integrase
MITDKQVLKAIRDVETGDKKAVELRDKTGDRGAGRLILLARKIGKRGVAEWYAVFYRCGKRVWMKLGTYPAMPVSDARATFGSDYAPAISAGKTPEPRRKDNAPGTLAELFAAYVASLRAKGKRVADAAEGYLGHASKAIGSDRAASEIVAKDIVKHLASIHKRGAETHANTVRAYIGAAFNYGLKAANDFTEATSGEDWGLKTNPVAAIPVNRAAKRVGERFLNPVEVRTFWKWLEAYQEDSLHASVALLRVCTGQRTEELLRITTKSYEKGKALLYWGKTKNGLPHSVPIPHQAVAVLDGLTPNGHGLYFPHRFDPASFASYHSVARVVVVFLKEHPDFEPFAPRDLRRTWKTLAGDAGIPKDMRDRLQNHVQGGVSAKHYDRYDQLAERRAAMRVWQDYLDKVLSGEIVEIGQRASNVVPFDTAAA